MRLASWALALLPLVGGEWLKWPKGAEPPAGVEVKVDAETGETWINATDANMEARWRASVNAATKKDDPTVELSPREAMVSALSKLPDYSGIDLGLLPEADLRAMWDARQEELRIFTEAHVSDVAKMLKKRVISLNAYLDVSAAGHGRADAAQLLRDEAVLWTLGELEYELGDVDNARDFHDSLRGWPALASLLDANAPRAVRAEAMKVVGSCVKNEPRFQTWLLEGSDPPLQRLVAALDEADGVGNAAIVVSGAPIDGEALRRAALYALGSALRSNGDTTAAFVALEGPAALRRGADAALAKTPRGRFSSGPWTAVERVAALVADLAGDAATKVHFAAEDWCPFFFQILASTPASRRADKVLTAAAALPCPWVDAGDDIRRLAGELRVAENLDDAFRDELAANAMHLVEPRAAEQEEAFDEDYFKDLFGADFNPDEPLRIKLR
ncbi:hypothetical protein M885DRAFT_566612 [Pelagophyceae sp. CCMP2097]|nr:hypothetical protein M885DRAFT_566612 [Pelagophyceae sp. CCMP2097]